MNQKRVSINLTNLSNVLEPFVGRVYGMWIVNCGFWVYCIISVSVSVYDGQNSLV